MTFCYYLSLNGQVMKKFEVALKIALQWHLKWLLIKCVFPAKGVLKKWMFMCIYKKKTITISFMSKAQVLDRKIIIWNYAWRRRHCVGSKLHKILTYMDYSSFSNQKMSLRSYQYWISHMYYYFLVEIIFFGQSEQ